MPSVRKRKVSDSRAASSSSITKTVRFNARRPDGSGYPRLSNGNAKAKSGATQGRFFDPYLTLMVFDDCATNRQAQAHALPLTALEGLEDLALHTGGDARPAVFHPRDPAARLLLGADSQTSVGLIAKRFRGETEPIDRLAGHIPGARNRVFKLNQNPDQSFRPAAELRAAFTALLGAVPPAAVVHHCGSGVTACVNRLAMDYAGLPGSALYVGSWSEWIADPARPVATGPA